VTVAVVTVTYGDRWRLLDQVLEAVAALDGADSIAAVVVVDNGAGPATRRLLQRYPSVEVVTLAENQGSAAGFAAGIARAIELGTDLIWLLDDDNRPRHNALKELLAAVAELGPGTALQCMRPSYEPLRRLAAGSHPQEVFGSPNGFLGESVRRRFGRSGRRGAIDVAYPAMPWAMYGGFLAPRGAFGAAGSPRADYVMYADDSEYTHRIGRGGWAIRLVPEAVVDDVDAAWWEVAGERDGVTAAVTARVETAGEIRRMYYSVRNSVHFERTRRVTSRSEYAVNAAAKLALMTAVCSLSAVKRRSLAPLQALYWFVVACTHGLRGRLGPYGRLDRREDE
jgi:GT2 family glycosyltransferase